MSHSQASTSNKFPDVSFSKSEKVYETAIKELPTSKMYDLYLDFLESKVMYLSSIWQILRNCTTL